MTLFRLTMITFLIAFWAAVLLGCALPSPTTDIQERGHPLPAVEMTGGTFFRHRWWNYYQRGISYAEDRQWSRAVADFSAAIGQREDDRRMARTYGMHFIDYFPSRELGILYFEIGRYQDAKDALERSIDSYPSAKARFYLDQVRRTLIQKSRSLAAPPRVALSLRGGDVWTREDPVFIEGTAWDDAYISSVTINADPLYMDGSQKRFVFQSPLRLPEGHHEIIVEAVNLMGRSVQRAVTIHVDRQGPLIALEQILRQASGKGDGYEIRGRITDAAGVSTLSLNEIPATILKDAEVPFRYRLPVGEDRLRIDAVDRLGNLTTAVFEVDKYLSWISRPILLAMADGFGTNEVLASIVGGQDRQPPELELKDWSERQTVYLEKIYLDGVVSDPGQVARLTVNGSTLLSRPAKIAYFNHMIELDQGLNTISVKATDSSGNQTEKRLTIIRKIPQALDLGARLKVTVLPFDMQGDMSAASLSFQTHMLDALYRRNRFRLVERDALDAILQEQKLSQTALIDQRTAVHVGRLASAQSIIAGDIIETRRGIEIVSRMIDTETSDILASEDVYSETKDRQSMRALADGMAIKYHRDFPLVGGVVVKKNGKSIITDLGAETVRLHRCILVYDESPIHHPSTGALLGADKAILCRARVTMVDTDISKAELLGDSSDSVRELHKVITQ
jgi:tetratricopeptide (TPR) repeat protein/TolB-like protein